MKNDMKYDVFISYSNEDKKSPKGFVAILKRTIYVVLSLTATYRKV